MSSAYKYDFGRVNETGKRISVAAMKKKAWQPCYFFMSGAK